MKHSARILAIVLAALFLLTIVAGIAAIALR